MSGESHHHINTAAKIPTQIKEVADQCGPGSPCVDGSCCNSEGKCGYTPYNCGSTPTTTCISNCYSRAMCGTNSRDSAQKCPLNLCCSYFGYCGVCCTSDSYIGLFTDPVKASEVYCGNPNGMAPCQQGFGSCQTASVPSCSGGSSASGGRKVAYYQAGNLMYRRCNRISPWDIVPRDLTHLIFAFVFINPNTFEVEPENDPQDRALYYEFAALKTSTTQTWLSIGGYGFSDPGNTFTTWSVLCADQGRRARFIASLINFMTAWGFQGVDIDWEYPVESNRGGRPIDTANLNSLIQEMRVAFGTKFGISIALPADYTYVQHFDVATLSQSIDFFNFMTYDLHGPWEAGTLGATLRAPSSVADIGNALLPLWYANVPPSKINIGLSMYGRSYTLQDPNCAELGCPYTGSGNPGVCTDAPGLLSLWEIALLRQDKDLGSKFLPDVLMEQMSYDNQYVIFDASLTVDRKLQWADGLCLGGLVYWGVDLYSSWGRYAKALPSNSSH
ncbi:glycoside hydrolase superfamily [Leptodontidium sp. MPI-SDFR-AT-0119]|nr:glycoside hydrolase superfamily [Leptodontidium sp. MPI-SDFR-AT-0119]